MDDFKQTVWEEIEKRYAACIDDVSLKNVSMQQMATALGEDVFMKAIFSDSYFRRCKLCGRPFIITTGRDNRARYCTRLFDDKHTCREVGPSVIRKRDPITKVMDASRRLHLRRRSIKLKTDAGAANDNYTLWLEYALECEKACRAGKISLDELKECIGCSYRADVDNSNDESKRDE